MRKSYLPLISIVLMLATLLSPRFYPAFSSTLGSITLVVSLALSIYTIFQTHKGTENARLKIFKEVGLLVLTLIAIVFLGGIAAMLANAQVSGRWGEMAGLLSAIGASFVAGYLVRKGMLKAFPSHANGP